MSLFVMAAFALILWILQGMAYHYFWTKGLFVGLSFAPAAVTEGESAILKETITNAKALPLPVLHVKFQMGRYLVFTSSRNFKITDHNYRSDIFSCMPWQEIRRSLEVSCKKRGFYTVSQADLVSYDLFFSSHLVASFPVETSLYVYPKTVAFEKLNLPFSSLMGQILTRRALILDPFETQSVRPYERFDPYRSVNWKATARTGDLKVNVYTPTTSCQVMFLLDVSSDRIWKDQDLTEEAIRLCGSYSHLLIREGIPVSVCTNGTDCLTGRQGFVNAGAGTDHVRAIMELLARIQIDDEDCVPMEQILKQLASGCSDSVIYILISPKQRDSMYQSLMALDLITFGCQWIVPMRTGQTVETGHLGRISVFPWEVPYDYSPLS